ncbi:hypothetical protein L209DRAFT_779054, partial [Thermothelomyces heterothallicus CBS 203.75]
MASAAQVQRPGNNLQRCQRSEPAVEHRQEIVARGSLFDELSRIVLQRKEHRGRPISATGRAATDDSEACSSQTQSSLLSGPVAAKPYIFHADSMADHQASPRTMVIRNQVKKEPGHPIYISDLQKPTSSPSMPTIASTTIAASASSSILRCSSSAGLKA